MEITQHQAPAPEHDASLSNSTSASRTSAASRWISYLPGLSVTVAGAGAAWFIAQLIPGISPLLIAILVGALWRNLIRVPRRLSPGIAFSSKKLLRAGIVLLGLQLSLSSILGLGPGVLLVVAASVGITFGVTLIAGRLMGISLTQRLLVASGVSICGAAAVAATENATDAKEEETATAIGLVVLFGTLMIPAVPFLGSLLGLDAESTGMWIGASTHEVAQVVAAGSAVGGGALAVAVTVKLARVLTLAPMVAGISLYMRKTGAVADGKRPPIVPLFIVGFLAAVLLRSSGIVPDPLLTAGQILQTILLAAAMFALGLGLDLKGLIKVGGRPVLLGFGATLVILGVALAGTLLFPPL
ncbi:putative sulfate exporter family transporter [Arthrobacter sp. Sa2CUA1]|uniref:Sulfate exporter family transporter n=1 Tax=Arthrobacter gallicola TaxID=2762225 RepID=A0ABR8UPT3_9MICC|nr:putative sulfate exporter family transporter [Arthrobacter gallicola]MBD7994571.1 putative sulfate exporter family transporter [Arthrobacter gallicola]